MNVHELKKVLERFPEDLKVVVDANEDGGYHDITDTLVYEVRVTENKTDDTWFCGSYYESYEGKKVLAISKDLKSNNITDGVKG